MSFDADCSTYWCDDCGRELSIDYGHSDGQLLTLSCKHCGPQMWFRLCSKDHSEHLTIVEGPFPPYDSVEVGDDEIAVAESMCDHFGEAPDDF